MPRLFEGICNKCKINRCSMYFFWLLAKTTQPCTRFIRVIHCIYITLYYKLASVVCVWATVVQGVPHACAPHMHHQRRPAIPLTSSQSLERHEFPLKLPCDTQASSCTLLFFPQRGYGSEYPSGAAVAFAALSCTQQVLLSQLGNLQPPIDAGWQHKTPRVRVGSSCYRCPQSRSTGHFPIQGIGMVKCTP